MNVIKNETCHYYSMQRGTPDDQIVNFVVIIKIQVKVHTWLWWIMKIDEAFSVVNVMWCLRVHVQLGCRWGQLRCRWGQLGAGGAS